MAIERDLAIKALARHQGMKAEDIADDTRVVSPYAFSQALLVFTGRGVTGDIGEIRTLKDALEKLTLC